jgi:predicted nucleotidyltransferase
MKYKVKLELPLAVITNFCKRWKVNEFSVFGSVFLERGDI